MRRLFAQLVLAAAIVLLPATALAEPTKEQIAEARTHFNKGIELYEDGDYEAALIELQRAYDTAPAYKILYSMGLVQRQLNDYAGSLRSFKKFLDDGGKKIDAKRRSEVEREINKLQGRVAQVKLTTNVEGAEVTVDDNDVGKTPLSEPLLVNMGKRRISASKSGYATASRLIRVGGGDTIDLQLELKKSGSTDTAPAPPSEPGKPAEPAEPAQPDEPAPTDTASGGGFPWLPWAITGVLAVGTGVVGVMALSAESDLASEREGVTSRDKLDDAESKMRTLALVTDVLLAATVISAGVSLYITLGSSDSEPADKEQGRARPVQLGIGPGSVQLRGSF